MDEPDEGYKWPYCTGHERTDAVRGVDKRVPGEEGHVVDGQGLVSDAKRLAVRLRGCLCTVLEHFLDAL